MKTVSQTTTSSKFALTNLIIPTYFKKWFLKRANIIRTKLNQFRKYKKKRIYVKIYPYIRITKHLLSQIQLSSLKILNLKNPIKIGEVKAFKKQNIIKL